MASQVPLLIAAVPLIAEYLQRSAAGRKERDNIRAQELRSAQEVIDLRGEQLSGLHYYLLEVMFASIYDRSRAVETDAVKPRPKRWVEEDERTWKTYRCALVEWKKARLLAVAATNRYFGAQTSQQLTEIANNINILERQINAAYFFEPKSRFYIRDTQADGPQDDENGVFLDLKRTYIDKENFNFQDSELYKNLSDSFKEDYRVRFIPLHRKVGKQIAELHHSMSSSVQKLAVGVLRKQVGPKR